MSRPTQKERGKRAHNQDVEVEVHDGKKVFATLGKTSHARGTAIKGAIRPSLLTDKEARKTNNTNPSINDIHPTDYVRTGKEKFISVKICEQSEEIMRTRNLCNNWDAELEDSFKSISAKGMSTLGTAYFSRMEREPPHLSTGGLTGFIHHKITPQLLHMLYRETRMHQNIIGRNLYQKQKKGTKKVKKKTGGKSASKWTFDNLIDLSCIPLLDVGLEAIIPHNFRTLSEEVDQLIKGSFDAETILNNLEEATKEDLILYDGSREMKKFLGNPWCLCFTLLRDLLTRNDAEVRLRTQQKIQKKSKTNLDVTLEDESMYEDEDKDETSSEQLLHRFMEVILLLFSIISKSRDALRSTPGRAKEDIQICNKSCQIFDDGYVYMTRGGTTPHKNDDSNKHGDQPLIEEDEEVSASDRNRYGWVPAKRLDTASGQSGDPICQIFSELLSAAIINMRYFDENVSPPEVQPLLAKVTKKKHVAIDHHSASYHDAFVISIRHYKLSIHTARFPLSYLKWVTTHMDEGDVECPVNYFILHKATAEYDLSDPDSRRKAARDILVLLWAIKNGNESFDGGVYVARVAVPLKTGGPKLQAEKDKVPLADKSSIEIEGADIVEANAGSWQLYEGPRNKSLGKIEEETVL